MSGGGRCLLGCSPARMKRRIRLCAPLSRQLETMILALWEITGPGRSHRPRLASFVPVFPPRRFGCWCKAWRVTDSHGARPYFSGVTKRFKSANAMSVARPTFLTGRSPDWISS